MERDPDFPEQDSGVPVTSPERDPDPLGPQHAAPAGTPSGASGPAAAEQARERHGGEGDDAAGESPLEGEGGPAVAGGDDAGGVGESNPATGL